jgi:hypothetical protein
MKGIYIVLFLVIGLLIIFASDILGMAIYENTHGLNQVCQQGIEIKICVENKSKS